MTFDSIWMKNLTMVKQLNKKSIQTATLLVGILTALLLIFGTFFQSADSFTLHESIGSVVEPASLEFVKSFSSTFIKIINSLNL